jgi:hypothetical protein
MSWREKLVVRILLLVARIVASGISEFDQDLADEIRHIANHVAVNAPDDH